MVVQHLRAAVHLASGAVQVLSEAAVVAAEIAKGPEGTDKDSRLVYQCVREACEGASSAAALAAQMTTLVNTAEGRVRREVKKMLNHWKKKDECGPGMESQSNPFASVRNLLQTSAQQQCGVDGWYVPPLCSFDALIQRAPTLRMQCFHDHAGSCCLWVVDGA